MNLFAVPIDQWWACAIYYLPSMGYCALFAVVATVIIFLFRKNKKCPVGWIIYLPLALALLAWMGYFTTTARSAFAITYLDTEDDGMAERVYKTIFDVDLNRAIRLALDNRQTGNVRFYASCRIADLLIPSDGQTRSNVLDDVSSATAFGTDFFGTNSLTVGFFTPNYHEGPFTVREIIERRLKMNQRSD